MKTIDEIVAESIIGFAEFPALIFSTSSTSQIFILDDGHNHLGGMQYSNSRGEPGAIVKKVTKQILAFDRFNLRFAFNVTQVQYYPYF